MERYIAIAIVLLTSCGRVPAGPQGVSGGVGLQGAPGATGATGPQGTAGEDTSSIYMVKLCPGDSIYPSTFVEYAFCVNNNLYGTYSANGGFSTLLPPGQYSSNAINSSCNFSVLPNCLVTQ